MSGAADRPLRVLFVTSVAPEVASGGGRTATESFLGVLRMAPLRAEAEVLALRTGREVLPHRVRQLLALARSVFGELPSKSLFDAMPGAVDRLKAALAARPHDLVVINGGDLYYLTRELGASQRCIGLALNVESELYEEQTAWARRLPILGGLFARDLEKLRRVESGALGRMQGVVCVSSDDAATFRRFAPELPVLALPTSFAYAPYEREASRPLGRPLRLGLLAKYRWWPNAEAVEWIVRRVLPALPSGRAELHLYGFGAERFAGRHPAVVAHGYVEDLGEVWAQSDIMVCPIVSGSGINIKLVEAVYNRNPVLATSHALRGLPALDDPAIVRLDTPEEWIAFLSGEAAEALARRTPSSATAELFSSRMAAPVLAEFIGTLMTRLR